MASDSSNRELLAEKECAVFEAHAEQFSSGGELAHIGSLLQRASSNYFDDLALTTPKGDFSFGRLYFLSIKLSQELYSAGLQAHDRVMIHSENSAFFYIAYFAILQAGGVVVPVNTFLHTKELAYIIREAAPTFVLAQDCYAPKMRVGFEEAGIEKVPVWGESHIDWSVKVDSKDDLPDFQPTYLSSDVIAAILYTSGTTGAPKGIALSSRNMVTNGLQLMTRMNSLGLGREKFFAILPLFHAFAQNACIWLPFMSGSSVIVVPKIERRWLRDGLKKKPTMLVGVPALYGILCMMKNVRMDSVKLFVSGADSLPDKIKTYFGLLYGRKLCEGYGLTEASPVVSMCDCMRTGADCNVGRPLHGVECEIRDDKDNVVPDGQSGVLHVRGDNVMLGYYKDVELTSEFLQNGWFNTGDIVSIGRNGRIKILGRVKDLIIHKGLNVYPQEIENVLMRHPKVARAAVLARKDDSSGQVPIAFVSLRDGSQPEVSHELRRHCAKFLAAYKVPKSVVSLDNIPVNATGKIDKKKLRQIGE